MKLLKCLFVFIEFGWLPIYSALPDRWQLISVHKLAATIEIHIICCWFAAFIARYRVIDSHLTQMSLHLPSPQPTHRFNWKPKKMETRERINLDGEMQKRNKRNNADSCRDCTGRLVHFNWIDPTVIRHLRPHSLERHLSNWISGVSMSDDPFQSAPIRRRSAAIFPPSALPPVGSFN